MKSFNCKNYEVFTMSEEIPSREWFLASEYLPTPPSSSIEEEIDNRCILCFDSLEKESCITLRCNHTFHLGCWLKVVNKSKCCLCTLATDSAAALVNAGISVTPEVTNEPTFLHISDLPYTLNIRNWGITNTEILASIEESLPDWGTPIEDQKFSDEQENTIIEDEVEFIQFHTRRTSLRKLSKMMKQLRTKFNVQRRQNVALLSMMQSEILKCLD